MSTSNGGSRARAELSYAPVLSDAPGIVAETRAARVLVVGGRLPEGVEVAAELRQVASPSVRIPTGVYSFDSDGATWVMVVVDGAGPSQPASVRSWGSALDDDPLVRAYRWLVSWWDGADVIPSPTFEVGDEVLVAPESQEGLVKSRQHEHGQWFYKVRSKGRTFEVRESLLSPPTVDDDPHEWVSRTMESASALAATITAAKLTERLSDTVYSFRASRTIFRPYQFRPVLKFLESGRLRLLVADEVGLGKTIEAGLLWTELDARRQANRVLVVAPSGLVSKWKTEMNERFGYELVELDTTGLEGLLRKFEDDRFPARFHGVVSMERLRVWSGLERLAEIGPRFDLVVVDEAHAFRNEGTKSHALGALLSDWADAYVFLSATPLNLGNDDLFNLLELLSPGEFDDRSVLQQRLEPNAVLNGIASTLLDKDVTPSDRLRILDRLDEMTFGAGIVKRPEYAELRALLASPLDARAIVEVRRLIRRLHALEAVVTRTRKVEVEDRKAVREPVQMDVSWTDDEARFYERVDAWQRARARSLGMPAGFAIQMPMRLASTCLPAMRDRILAHAGGRIVDEVDLEPDEGPTSEESRGIGDDFESPPDDVVAATRRLGEVDSKFDVFVETLEDIVDQGRKVLVFSFSRPTLAYLLRRLSSRMRVRDMHGGVDRQDRAEIMASFRRGEFDVLLASKVASEGLDFEFCSAVVNYDLPWNPMEVEQRIGRVDRFGQSEEKVLVLNFHTPGTIESDIIARVHERIGVFTDSIGELEPILREKVDDLRKTMFDFELSEDQRRRKIDETLAAIEEQRAALKDVEDASGLLNSADGVEIQGLERDLVEHGRYVGQRELAHLLRGWVSRSPESRIEIDDEVLRLRGSSELESDLRLVQVEGDRSAAELDRLAADLRGGLEVHVSLSQEHARVTGLPLLSANHPLVRAAVASRGAKGARCANVMVFDESLPIGRYLVLLGVARWRGVRSTNELWTTAVDLSTRSTVADVGARLLASLADGAWREAPGSLEDPIDVLDVAISAMRSRQLQEEADRGARNDALLEVRRLSLEETFRRKRAVIGRRIETARANRSDVAVRLGLSQLAAQDRLLAQASDDLERAARTSMEVEHLAVAIVEVSR